MMNTHPRMCCALRAPVFAAALILGVLAPFAGSHAQEMPATKLRVIGGYSTLVQTQQVEKPFWLEEIPADSGGRITAEYANYDVMGLQEQQLLRLTASGVADFASTDIVKVAGDEPAFEGCDLTGISPDIETAHKACNAWAPEVSRIMEEKFNTKLLGLAPNPGLIFWCVPEVRGLQDIQGKKVRVNSRTMADMVIALGGSPVTTPFGEVVPSLQRGVFDCAITGSLAGNTAGWGEVTKYLLAVPVNWSIYYQSVNLKAWNKFDPAVRDYLTRKFASLDERLWAIGEKANQEGIDCNTGKDPCILGRKESMTLVPPSDADKARIKQVAQEVVLPQWAKRCGKECASRWNETVGKVVDMQIDLSTL
ncbi:MAG: TRAP transporter substrate-binding protein [Castellaniella sp.]